MLIAQSNIVSWYAFSVTFDPASVSSATSAEQDITVQGVKVGDIVLAVNKPSATAGVGIVNARVKAANTVSLTYMNATAGAVDPASEVYTFIIARPESLGAAMNV
jgi:hypothetical protein